MKNAVSSDEYFQEKHKETQFSAELPNIRFHDLRHTFATHAISSGVDAAALHALNNMDRDLLLVAKDDELARKLQDLGLPVRKRAPKRRW